LRNSGRVDQPGRLNRSQRLVVDRDRSRLVHGAVIALHERDNESSLAEQIRQHHAGRAGPHNGDIEMLFG
jgi:hypothetical protein